MAINLYELVNSLPLGLPMPKDSVIKIEYANKRISPRRYLLNGEYVTISKFRPYINGNGIDPQNWYDRNVLFIYTESARPKCKCGCGNDVKFVSVDEGYNEYSSYSHRYLHSNGMTISGDKNKDTISMLKDVCNKVTGIGYSISGLRCRKFYNPFPFTDGYSTYVDCKILLKVLSYVEVNENQYYDIMALNSLDYHKKPDCKNPNCTNKSEFNGYQYGYKKFCSLKCSKNFYSSDKDFLSYLGSRVKESLNLPEIKEKQCRSQKLSYTRERKEHLSILKKKRWEENRDLEMLARKKAAPKISEANRNKWKDDGYRERRRQITKEAYYKFNFSKILYDGKVNKMNNNESFLMSEINRIRRISSKKSHYKNGFIQSPKCSNSNDGFVNYDSSYELSVILDIEMNESIVSYEREPIIKDLIYEDSNGSIRYYWPDFIVTYKNGQRKMIEVKPKRILELRDKVTIQKILLAKNYCDKIGIKFSIYTESRVFKNNNRSDINELHEFLKAIKCGYKSTDEKIKEMLNIK